MKRRRVVITLTAYEDLREIQRWISQASSKRTAQAYVARLKASLREFHDDAEIGRARPDIAPGARHTHFDGRYNILFKVEDKRVLVFRIVHGARDLDRVIEQTDFDAA